MIETRLIASVWMRIAVLAAKTYLVTLLKTYQVDVKDHDHEMKLGTLLETTKPVSVKVSHRSQMASVKSSLKSSRRSRLPNANAHFTAGVCALVLNECITGTSGQGANAAETRRKKGYERPAFNFKTALSLSVRVR